MDTNREIYELFESCTAPKMPASLLVEAIVRAANDPKILVEAFDRYPNTPGGRDILAKDFIPIDGKGKAVLYMMMNMPPEIITFVNLFEPNGLTVNTDYRFYGDDNPKMNSSVVEAKMNISDSLMKSAVVDTDISESMYINAFCENWLSHRKADGTDIGLNLFRISSHVPGFDKDEWMRVEFAPSHPNAYVWMKVFGKDLLDKTSGNKFILKAYEQTERLFSSGMMWVGQRNTSSSRRITDVNAYLEECSKMHTVPENLNYAVGWPRSKLFAIASIPFLKKYGVQIPKTEFPQNRSELYASFANAMGGQNWNYVDFMRGKVYRSKEQINGNTIFVVFPPKFDPNFGNDVFHSSWNRRW